MASVHYFPSSGDQVRAYKCVEMMAASGVAKFLLILLASYRSTPDWLMSPTEAMYLK